MVRHVQLGMRQPLDLAVAALHPRVERAERLHRGRHVDLDTEVPQPAEAGHDVERYVLVSPTAGEPRPEPAIELLVCQLLERGGGLRVEPVGVEEQAHVAARLALVLRLAHPWRLLEQDRLQVLVLGERAVEGRRGFPQVEHAVDLRIGVGDVARERVGVKPVEDLLAALVRKLHQVRQRHHRIPRRLRRHLHRERLVAQRVGLAAREQLREGKRLRLLASDRQRHRLRHENPPAEHGQETLLAVAGLRGGADGLVREETEPVGHGDPPRIAARLLRRHVKRLLGRAEPQRSIDRLLRGGIGKRELHRALLRLVALVAHLHGELNRVALAHEARRVGLDHEILRGDGLAGEQPGAELRIVREAEELPLGERLRHRERHPHRAVRARRQVREEERGLVEILPRGDFGEIRLGCCAFKILLSHHREARIHICHHGLMT